MAKQTGLGDRLFVSNFDLSGTTGSVGSISRSVGTTDVTAIDKSANERIYTLKEGAINFSSFFDPAAAAAHAALAPMPVADRIVTYNRGAALGSPAASMVAKQINYDPTRAADGALTMDVQTLANGFGLEWGRQLTAGKITHASATNGTGVDGVASTDFGLQAYLHIFSLASGTPSVHIESSATLGGTYTDVTGGVFTLAAAGGQRIATAADLTVARFLRIATSGTFSNLVFAVSVVRNERAPSF